MDKGDIVFHKKFGEGEIRSRDDETAIARFDSGLEECLLTDLKLIQSASDRIEKRNFDEMLPTLCHVMASAIRSINDEWGVFSTSRINLLPHQLWVCRRVLETDPARWLVADDVGLGKTIEAGLVLLALRSAGRLRRCLIIAPASLTSQWKERMLKMFDLRFEIYNSKEDNPKNTSFWQGDVLMIASMQTLSIQKKGRTERLLDAAIWDMVIVDEAHRLNIEQRNKGTLSYQLLANLQKAGKINSLLFFTGTPHKGKEFNFFSLLGLLRNDLYPDANNLSDTAYDDIPLVMIRNNKQKVTDMAGNKLFEPVTIFKEQYSYSPEEATFYDTLSEFIVTGRIYAQNQNASLQRVIYFLLATIQKLASSSIAAVAQALKNRVASLEQQLSQTKAKIDELETDELEDGQAEKDAAVASIIASMLPDEIKALRELINLAEAIDSETKMTKILDTIGTLYANGESILFFTEYKQTQALLVSLLRAKYGKENVVFINGDNALTFTDALGEQKRENMKREDASDLFNKGKARFLVSTEAAGEGVDLQENCHVLFHVDLPWNPMRLHQRVGRLHRYGQKLPVNVHLFRNPDTVESRIWDCLEIKLAAITAAFSTLDDPEDMCQAVIGTAANSFFTELFAHAPKNKDGVTEWFDSKTSTFGGEDAISQVRKLFGQVSRFDFGTSAANLPKVDLKDLMPYVKLTLQRIGQKMQKTDSKAKLSFKTPKALQGFNTAPQFTLVFSRDERCETGEDLAGMGLSIIDQMVNSGYILQERYALIPGLDQPLFIFRLRDKTTENKQFRQRLVAVKKDGDTWKMLRDWELLLLLNELVTKFPLKQEYQGQHISSLDMNQAKNWLSQNVGSLNLPYKSVALQPFAALCPVT